MPHGTSTARESLARALCATTIHRQLKLPADLAEQLLNPDDEVLLALPGIPDEKPKVVLVTAREVVFGRWNAVGRAPTEVTRKRAVPAGDVRGASYTPGMNYKVETQVDSARDLSLIPCTVEDGIRFAHALHTLATTGRLPSPLPPAEVIAARHADGLCSPDNDENRVRAEWDRALLATTALWNCTAVHSGPALGWLQPGEHTFLVLLGQVVISTEFLAATDRRILRGSAPGSRLKEHPASEVARAVYDEGWLKDTAKVEMRDGTTLTLDAVNPLEGLEFVDALNTLVSTGALPPELQPFR